MKKNMILTLITAAFMAACTVLEPEPIIGSSENFSPSDTVKTVKNKDFKEIYKKKNNSNGIFIPVGDTLMTYKNPKLHTPPTKDPDLSKIKNDKDPDLKGKPLTMLVIGGSLSAGVRDGGYFNEGMLTSYPNLVARQMKLKKFELPLFDANEYNGTGRMAKTNFNPTGGPIQKYKTVTNNLGLTLDQETDKNIVKNYKGNPDNLAVPFAIRTSLTTGNRTSEISSTMIKRIKGEDINSRGLKDLLKNKKSDFFILESGLEEVVTIALKTLMSGTAIVVKDYTFKDNLTFEEQYIYSAPELQIIRDYLNPNTKGVLLNVPNILDLPVFLSNNEIIKNTILYNYYSPLFNQAPNIVRLLPSHKVDSMLSPKVNIMLKPGLNANNPLTRFDFLNKGEDDVSLLNFMNDYNNMLLSFNEKWGFPIVDIKDLYHKVLTKEGFKEENGVLLNAENFFSDDKINPSALGQAVIANEVIKAINTGYKTAIPLINIREYIAK